MTDPAAAVITNELGADSGPTGVPVKARVQVPTVGPVLGRERALPEERVAPPPPPLWVPGQMPELMPDTPMQKVVLPGLVELTLGNVVVPGRFDPHRVAGLVMRLEDVPAGSSHELARRLGLNEVAGWPVADELYVARFYAHHPQLYFAPFERSVYQLDLIELPAGTELWRIDAQGDEQRVGAYLNRQVGWVSTRPALLGPGGWNRPPVPLRPTLRRGLVAQYRGESFDADFGPRPGEVTLHPLPGMRPPAEFIDQAGVHTLPVTISELDSLELVRWCGGWYGLPVELVEAGPERTVIHYLGGNGPRAAEFGLAEVDYRVWRGSVPRNELIDVQEQRVALHGCAP